MKTTILFLVTALLAFAGCKKQCDCKGKDAPAATPKSGTTSTPAGAVDLSLNEYKMLYFMAYMNGKNLKRDGMKMNTAALVAGANDGWNDKEPLVTQEQIRPILMEMRKKAMERMKGRMPQPKPASPEMLAKAKENEKKANDFLEKNKKEKGVIVHPSGFQYKILRDAKGEKPTATDKVSCHYKGTLLDGTKFDSSYDRGAPTTFPLNRVIKGWTLGIPLMPVGSKFIFWIPGKLAYGMTPPTPKIGPMDMLVFEVELVSIAGKPAPKTDMKADAMAPAKPAAKPVAKPTPKAMK